MPRPQPKPQLPPPDPLLMALVKALAIKAAREDHARERQRKDAGAGG